MNPGFIDNRSTTLKDELARVISSGDTVSVAASVFSMYAFDALREQLESVNEFRFIYTEPTFTKERTRKEQREFYIPRLAREQGLYGTGFEIKLRNELTQKAVSSECAQWIRRKARFRALKEKNEGGAPVTPSLTVSKADDTVSYLPIPEFTTSSLRSGRPSGTDGHLAARYGYLDGFSADI